MPAANKTLSDQEAWVVGCNAARPFVSVGYYMASFHTLEDTSWLINSPSMSEGSCGICGRN
jgi:hypothetical protein